MSSYIWVCKSCDMSVAMEKWVPKVCINCGKPLSIKAAIGAIDLIRQGIDEVLLERYIDD